MQTKCKEKLRKCKFFSAFSKITIDNVIAQMISLFVQLRKGLKMFNFFEKLFVLAIAAGFLISCSDSRIQDEDSILKYPNYVFEKMIFMGKAGFPQDKNPTNAEIDTALSIAIWGFIDSLASSDNIVIIDGIEYEMDYENLKNATGGLPKSEIDAFWRNLDFYYAAQFSCWAYMHGTIPSRKSSFSAYVIFAIVTEESDQAGRYFSFLVDYNPKNQKGK